MFDVNKIDKNRRTTLAINDDVLMAVKGLAATQKKSVGEVISVLIRQALQPVSVANKVRNRVHLLSVRLGATLVTPALINQLRDELP